MTGCVTKRKFPSGVHGNILVNDHGLPGAIPNGAVNQIMRQAANGEHEWVDHLAEYVQVNTAALGNLVPNNITTLQELINWLDTVDLDSDVLEQTVADNLAALTALQNLVASRLQTFVDLGVIDATAYAALPVAGTVTLDFAAGSQQKVEWDVTDPLNIEVVNWPVGEYGDLFLEIVTTQVPSAISYPTGSDTDVNIPVFSTGGRYVIVISGSDSASLMVSHAFANQ